MMESFMAKVTPEPMSGCWLWTAFSDKKGYGRFRERAAHRVAWELFKGPIPGGMSVLHRCDNPGCVNAAGGHLFLGTQLDNVRDMAAKGRRYSSPKCPHGVASWMCRVCAAAKRLRDRGLRRGFPV